jgi:sugar phosphate permease
MRNARVLDPGSPASRWVVFAIAVCAYVLGLFHRVAPATIAGDLTAAFQTSAATLGALAATYFWIYTAMQLPCGVLADTVGPKRLLVVGGLIAAVGAGAFAAAPTFWVAAAGRTLVGLGTSVAFVATLKLTATWFDERRFATLTGVTVLAGNFASAAAGAPFAWALSVFSWREVMAVLAAASVAVAIAAAALVRDRPVRAPSPAERGVWKAGLLAVMSNRANWPIFMANLFMGGSFFALAGLWGVPYLMEIHDRTRLEAANHPSLQLGAFAIAALVIGTVSDRIARRKALFVAGAAGFAAAIAPLAFGWRPGLVASYALFAVMGFCAAGFTMGWSSAKELNPRRFAGIATSFVNLAIFLGPAILQPLVGRVLDLGGRTPQAWTMAMRVIFASAALAVVFALLVRETYARAVDDADPVLSSGATPTSRFRP